MVQIASAESMASEKVLQKRRGLLEAASRIFRKKGVHATTMRDIAHESGMHVGNLYYYFRSKQELLSFCQKDALDGLAIIADRVEQMVAQADTRLALLIMGHFVLLNESRQGSTAHLEVEAVSPVRRKEIRTLRRRYESVYHRVILEGQNSGKFRPASSQTITLAILGALNWSVRWYRPTGRKSAIDMAWEFADYLVSGLLSAGQTLVQPSPSECQLVTDLGTPTAVLAT